MLSERLEIIYMNKETIKILHLSKATGIAGSENHLLSLLPRLDRSRYEITFMILTEPDKPLNDYFQMLEENGVKTKRLIIRRDIDPLCLWEIYQFIRRNRFDIVHTHLIHADLYGTLAAKIAGVKYTISTKHGYNEFRYNKLYALLDRTSSYFQNKIITISNALKRFLNEVEGLSEEKMVTIYYGLDEARISGKESNQTDLRLELGISHTDRLLCCLGRLIPVKGFKNIIEAMPLILNEFPVVHLVIVGDGPLRTELGSLVKELSLSDHVYFLGFRRDIGNILSQVDVFVHPTYGEGFGLVLLEAMYYNLPIVSTHIMSIPEIVIDGETGLLVPSGNKRALADAVLQLIRSPESAKRMGTSGKERVGLFSVERMVKNIEALYGEFV
jgi:glycosyltransferase involved in cell wall biosynthesis